jgi:hypothetical protein
MSLVGDAFRLHTRMLIDFGELPDEYDGSWRRRISCVRASGGAVPVLPFSDRSIARAPAKPDRLDVCLLIRKMGVVPLRREQSRGRPTEAGPKVGFSIRPLSGPANIGRAAYCRGLQTKGARRRSVRHPTEHGCSPPLPPAGLLAARAVRPILKGFTARSFPARKHDCSVNAFISARPLNVSGRRTASCRSSKSRAAV